jgi:hypothetical protein
MDNENVQNESADSDQALAICSTLWDERNMTPNEKLLALIKSRQQKNTEFGYGILTADRHVRNMVDACGLDAYEKLMPSRSMSFDDCLQKAKGTLVYSNADMRVEEVKQTSEVSDIELPKNTLMVFKHVLTTPRKDRDGDVLRTQGAEVDPNMLLLWQHVHTLPIGKMLQIAEQNSNKLSLISAIVDMNELSHDAAVMVDNDMARFSHGFRALQFEELKEEEGDVTSPGGFDIKQFEIMEESIVSVPSNVDAQVEEQMLDLIEGNRLTSDMMKEYGRTLRERHPVSIPVTVDITTKVNGVVQTNETADEVRKRLSASERQQVEEAVRQQMYGNHLSLVGNPAIIDGMIEQIDRLSATHNETKEVQNEDKSRGGSASSEEQGNEGDPSTPEEAKTTGVETVETEATQDQKMSGPLEGSWEWIESELRRSAKNFLQTTDIGMGDRDWAYVVATFADHAVVCVEKPEAGVPDEFRYFKVEWELKDGKPEFKGTPVQVEIVTTTELIERYPNLVSMKSQAEKTGRALSRGTVRILTDVKDDLIELKERENMSRGGGAICDRCVDKLTGLIGEPEEETSTEIDTKTAIVHVLSHASSSERASLIKLLNGIELIESKAKNRQVIRALVGH